MVFTNEEIRVRMNGKSTNGLNRKEGFSRRILIGLLTLLVLASAVAAVFDWRRVQRTTHDLTVRQAQDLAQRLQNQIELVTNGDRIVRQLQRDHLVSVADLIARSSILSRLTPLQWVGLAKEGGVRHFELLDPAGKRIGGTPDAPDVSDSLRAEWMEDLLFDDDGVLDLGVFTSKDSSESLIGVLVSLQDGALIVDGDATTLLDWRRQAGLPAILEYLQRYPFVDYAVIVSGDAILAGTSPLPNWFGTEEDPFQMAADTTGGFTASFVGSTRNLKFEAAIPLENYPGVVLRLGINTGPLQMIQSRSLFGLVLRTVLFIVLAGLILVWFVTREHHHALTLETERIRREVERLEASRSVSERLEAMGKLAGGVAHEIRNPLNTIGMVAQRLESEFEPSTDVEEYRSLLRAMREEGRRIERIVENFLALARPPRAELREGNLTQTLDSVVAMFASSAAAGNVRFEHSIDPITPFAFDAEHIRAAVLNLLKNALDFVSGEKGWIRLSAHANDDRVVIEVADNGPGVPKEEWTRIFHLYYTTKADGTGVGLAVVQRTAEEHGGRVEVDDTPGGGATFRLVLKRERT
ncbi:MAG: HAMP domain-containing sensor histidine kinase [bacterium]